jgi:hypothetical protein
MRSAITPGGILPEYALPDHTGTARTLSELQGRGPPILTLARGHYCPKEHQQHLDLAGSVREPIAVTLVDDWRRCEHVRPWVAAAH